MRKSTIIGILTVILVVIIGYLMIAALYGQYGIVLIGSTTLILTLKFGFPK
jgi:hypothetical protein